MKRLVALILCAGLAAPGCAARAPRVQTDPAQAHNTVDPALLAEYAQKLPLGSAVRLERSNGRTVRGTLMKATATSLVVQPRTRIPEAPVEIPLVEVLSLTPEGGRDGGTTLAKAIGAGAAAGAGAALVIFFIIVAAFSD